MLAKRIIPCLDIKDNRVVKGIHFRDLKDAGDPVAQASIYDEEGADELVFLDITASKQKRKTLIELVRRIADVLTIPFTVGGGIKSIDDIYDILKAGADKVSINTSAVKNPKLIEKAVFEFGRQCIVVSIDALKKNEWYEVYIYGGTKPTRLDAYEWSKKVVELGAGEILLTSIDADGAQKGYDIELTKNISSIVNVPVIASGGAGTLKHIYDVLTIGKADAALMASILHYGKYSIREIKEYLLSRGINVRPI